MLYRSLVVSVLILNSLHARAESAHAGSAKALSEHALPSFDEVKHRDQVSDLVFLAKDGSRIDSIRIDSRFRKLAWVPLQEIAPLAREILIATEDQRFFDHAGVDWFSLASNAMKKLSGSRARGASTLTMQLVSLIDPTRAHKGKRDFSEKIDQIESALELEKTWTKDQILEAYLNLVPLKGELVGIHAASKVLFQKEVEALDPIDASLIVAMLPAPNDSTATIRKRACTFLKHVYEAKSSQAEDLCQELSARTLFADDKGSDVKEIASDHRINESYVYSVMKNLSSEQKQSGQIKTTLDLGLQNSVYRMAKETLHGIQDQNVSEVAVLAIRNDTGEVVSYIGSVPEFSKNPHVDGVLGRRQAGSTLKPFFYEQALKGHQVDLGSFLMDEPKMLQTMNGAFRPDNYDHEFHGKVTLPVALASSLNIPAIEIVEKIGEEQAVTTLKEFGFQELKPAFLYGPSIALGTVDVTLAELVHAYHRLWKQSQTENEARIIARILSDADSRTLTFGLNSVLNTPYYTSVKTGTSKDMRDNWCLGFSEHYTVGVWVGNFNGTPMKDVSGVSGAAPLWRKVMDELHANTGSHIPQAVAAIKLPELDLAVAKTKTQNASLVHIAYPSDQAVLAYDPEIPVSRQKVLFRVDGASDAASWFVNGKKVAALGKPYFWPVERGKFKLEVRNAKDEPLDSIQFLVK